MNTIIPIQFALALAAVAGGLMAVAVVLKLHEKGIYPLSEVTRIVKRPWFELAVLVFCVGGLVHYGATKGTNDTDGASAPLLVPWWSGSTSSSFESDTGSVLGDGLSGSSLFEVPDGSHDLAAGRSWTNDDVVISMPTNNVFVTNFNFYAIGKGTNSVLLGLCWPLGWNLTNQYADIIGTHTLETSNDWCYLSLIDLSVAQSNLAAKIEYGDFPTNAMETAAFFRASTRLDTDGDGLSDWEERYCHGTDPTQPDTDYDGLNDYWEIAHGYNPLVSDGTAVNSDADRDGLTLYDEVRLETDPNDPDTDGDGIPDGVEVPLADLSLNIMTAFTNTAFAACSSEVQQEILRLLYGSMHMLLSANGGDSSSSGNGNSDAGSAYEALYDSAPHTMNTGEPAKATNPQSANDEDFVSIGLIWGDPSISHSEKYRIRIMPTAGSAAGGSEIDKTNASYGEVKSLIVSLKKGYTYDVTLDHASSFFDTPDLDYVLTLDMPTNVILLTHGDLLGGHPDTDPGGITEQIRVLDDRHPELLANPHIIRFSSKQPQSVLNTLVPELSIVGPQAAGKTYTILANGMPEGFTGTNARIWPDKSSAYWGLQLTNRVSVSYSLYEDGVVISSDSCLYIESKEKEECDCTTCAEGTQCKDGCVSFAQKFGRALHVPGVAGTLRVDATHPSARLFTPHALAFEHPMMRRVVYRKDRDAVISDGCGGAVEYQKGYAVNYSAGLDAQIYLDDATNLVEVLPFRLRIVYGDEGDPIAFIPENGGYLPISEFGITVVRDASGAIGSITSDTDGTISVASTGDNAWRATWTSPSGAFVKRFDFSGNGSDVLNLTEYRNEDYSFNYRWTYDYGESDWIFEKGVGTEAAIRESKTTEWDEDSGSWIVTHRSENAAGETLSSETSIVAEEAGTLKTTSVVKAGKSLYSAELDGGFVSAEVSSLGGRTEYSRDRFGRVTRSVEYSNCGVTTADYREYDYSKGVYRDHRPVYEKTKLNGVEFLSVSREIGTNYEYVVRTAAGGVRESYTEYDAYGRIVLRIAESGRATRIAYADNNDGMSTETDDVGYISKDQFTLSDGKSTREVKTIDARGNVIRSESYAYIGGAFHLLDWETHQYNAAHKVIASTYSDGTGDAADWICPGPTWRRDRDGIVVSNRYNAAKLLASSVRYSPFGAVTTTYTYDGEGRVIREETSAADCETKTVTRTYDSRGRIASETDELGATTSYTYSADDLVTTVTYADGGTKITTLYTDGSVRSVTGTAVTSEYYTYGVTSEGLKWTQIRYGRSDSPRFKTTYVNGFEEIVREERSGANGSVLASNYYYDDFGAHVATCADGEPDKEYAYDELGGLTNTVQRADGIWRSVSEVSENALIDGEVFSIRTVTRSCSDAAIAPLSSRTMTQLSGLNQSSYYNKWIGLRRRGHRISTASSPCSLTSGRLARGKMRSS